MLQRPSVPARRGRTPNGPEGTTTPHVQSLTRGLTILVQHGVNRHGNQGSEKGDKENEFLLRCMFVGHGFQFYLMKRRARITSKILLASTRLVRLPVYWQPG